MAIDFLEVYLSGRLVGTLTRTRRGARFSYLPDLVREYAGQPILSAVLPVKQRPYSEGLTNAWFSGLLPEGERLERICRQLSCHPSDYLSVLAEIGWECAGAVSIVPHGSSEDRPAKYEPLDWMQLETKINELPLYSSEDGLPPRVSLGGYQEKLCLAARDVVVSEGFVSSAAFCLPSASAISTHILKPQPRGRYPHLIEGEAWAMRATSHAATCAKTSLLQVGDAPLTLLVERFDRDHAGEAPIRIHQEDCCQALGLPPSRKYALAKGPRGDEPSYQKIADLLMRYAQNSEAEKAELLRQVTVNLAIGNTDAHAKNHSLLYEAECSPRLSPMYDVLPVREIEPSSEILSMRIGGKITAAEVGRADLLNEAESWDVAFDPAVVIDDALESLASGVVDASETYPHAGSLFADAVNRRIEAFLGN